MISQIEVSKSCSCGAVSRLARLATKAYKKHLDLPLTDSEAKGLPEPELAGAAG